MDPILSWHTIFVHIKAGLIYVQAGAQITVYAVMYAGTCWITATSSLVR